MTTAEILTPDRVTNARKRHLKEATKHAMRVARKREGKR